MLKNEHDKNAQYLKPLLKLAYRKALDGNRFKSDEWNFLKNFLSQYFDISDLNFKVKSKYGDIQFDISSVSFIYHEMRFGSSERVKSLFRQVWETSKQECNRRSNLLQIFEITRYIYSIQRRYFCKYFRTRSKKTLSN